MSVTFDAETFVSRYFGPSMSVTRAAHRIISVTLIYTCTRRFRENGNVHDCAKCLLDLMHIAKKDGDSELITLINRVVHEGLRID